MFIGTDKIMILEVFSDLFPKFHLEDFYTSENWNFHAQRYSLNLLMLVI